MPPGEATFPNWTGFTGKVSESMRSRAPKMELLLVLLPWQWQFFTDAPQRLNGCYHDKLIPINGQSIPSRLL